MKKSLSILLVALMLLCGNVTTFAAYEYPARLMSNPLANPIPLPPEMRNAKSLPGFESRAIIGEDDTRWQIDQEDAESWPYNMIVRVFVEYEIGTSNATGFVVDDFTVLTAGHVIDDSKYGAIKSITVVPGSTDNSAPFGMFVADSSHLPDNYVATTATDYGVICLSENVGDVVGHFGWRNLRDPVDTVVEVAGHPESKNGQMWASSDVITAASSTLLHYTLDTEVGNSGSPAFIADCNAAGIHFGGISPRNTAVRLTDDVMTWVQSFFGPPA